MTRIDFYILAEGAKPPEGAAMTACKLCDKAVAAGSRIYIHAPDAEVAQTLDSLLWSFRQGGFISHERYTGAAPAEPLPSVLIGGAEPPASHQAVMINLGGQVPPFFSAFERVLEIVDGDAAQRAQSRERYKFYRDRGYELASHNL
jgi:DNA polymerase-3 subunit chi